MHREISVGDSSGTTAPRILKVGTNIGYDYLYRVRPNQHTHAYHFLSLSTFFIAKKYFVQDFSGTIAPRIMKLCTNLSNTSCIA